MTTPDAPVTVEEAATDAAFRAINGPDADPFASPESWDFAATVADAVRHRLAALASAPAGNGEHLTYDRMGSGGRCDWRHLREAVSEAVRGVREVDRDESSDIYTGHRAVLQINFNLLDRIVTAFVDAALARARAAADQCGKCRGSGHVQRGDSGECDACRGAGYHSPDTDSPRAAAVEREAIAACLYGNLYLLTAYNHGAGRVLNWPQLPETDFYRRKCLSLADAILALQSPPAKVE